MSLNLSLTNLLSDEKADVMLSKSSHGADTTKVRTVNMNDDLLQLHGMISLQLLGKCTRELGNNNNSH